jgi:Fe2+ transport system protein FeoA
MKKAHRAGLGDPIAVKVKSKAPAVRREVEEN